MSEGEVGLRGPEPGVISTAQTSTGTGARTPQTVLICAMNYAPEVVGVGRYVADVGRMMARRGDRVTVVTTPPHYPHWNTAPWRAAGFRNRYSFGSEPVHRGARQGQRVVDASVAAATGHGLRRLLSQCGGDESPPAELVTQTNALAVQRCPLPLPARMRGVWRMLAPLGFAVTAAPALIWRIMRSRPRLIICVEPTLAAAPLLVLLGRLTGARLVLYVQDLEPEAALAPYRWTRRLAVSASWWRRRFDAVVTLSDAMAAALQASGVAPSRLHVCPNWTDVRRIARGRDLDQERAWRQELGIAPEQRVVLCAGTINRKHAPQLLIDTARVLANRPDILVVAAGDGPLSYVIRHAAQGAPNLRWLPAQPEARLAALMHFADAHVLPLDETFDDLAMPSRLGAMLASGRPIAVTAAPHSALAKAPGEAGIVCPPGHPQALAAAVSAVLDLPPVELARMRRAAYRRALTLDQAPRIAALLDAFDGREINPHGMGPPTCGPSADARHQISGC